MIRLRLIKELTDKIDTFKHHTPDDRLNFVSNPVDIIKLIDSYKNSIFNYNYIEQISDFENHPFNKIVNEINKKVGKK